jgi:hypothetical protein
MDEDLKDALFCEDDDEYEELDDNFVIEALKQPSLPDFDYEAHIANLIAKSERATISCNPNLTQFNPNLLQHNPKL